MITKGDEAAGAIFSDNEKHRFHLWRCWDASKPRCNFCMLNPSKATHEVMDSTVTRCRNFAMDWGFGALDVTNIFALRSTDPEELYRFGVGSIGGVNNDFILSVARKASIVVCAWGQHGKYLDRGRIVRTILRVADIKLHYLRMGKGENPWHPLYLPSDLKPIEWVTA